MAARLTIKAVNDELARLGHQARPGRPHYVALACVLGGGVAGTSVTAFLIAACFSAALAGAMRPARFPGTFFADGLDVVGALAAVLAFLAAAHLALCAATIWARPFGLNFHFFTTRAAAAGEEAAGPTWSLWRRSAIRDSICLWICW
jgi:hypothetical protein